MWGVFALLALAVLSFANSKRIIKIYTEKNPKEKGKKGFTKRKK